MTCISQPIMTSWPQAPRLTLICRSPPTRAHPSLRRLGRWKVEQGADYFSLKNTQKHWLEMKGQRGKEFIFPTATESHLSLLKPTKHLYEWWWGHGSRREMAGVSVFSEPTTQMRRHAGTWLTKGKIIWTYVTPSRCGVLPTRRSIHSLSQEPIPLGYYRRGLRGGAGYASPSLCFWRLLPQPCISSVAPVARRQAQHAASFCGWPVLGLPWPCLLP